MGADLTWGLGRPRKGRRPEAVCYDPLCNQSVGRLRSARSLAWGQIPYMGGEVGGGGLRWCLYPFFCFDVKPSYGSSTSYAFLVRPLRVLRTCEGPRPRVVGSIEVGRYCTALSIRSPLERYGKRTVHTCESSYVRSGGGFRQGYK